MKRMIALAFAVVLSACGGGGPNSPSNQNQIPNVAGTYAGPIDFSADGTTLATLQGRMNVVQAGSQLTINGTMTYQGESFSIAAVTGTVNATGFFTVTGGGLATDMIDPTCGVIQPLDSSLTFSGNTARYVEHASSQFCGHWTMAGTLTR